MSNRYVTRLFKPPAKPDIAKAVVTAAVKIGARAAPSKSTQGSGILQIGVRKDVFTADFPYCDGDSIFFSSLAQELGGLWLEARIQEGSHWDYTLSYPNLPLDTFSTLPQYWDDDELLTLAQQGRPELLAKAWGISVETIDQYIRQWGITRKTTEVYDVRLKGKAYPQDRFEYGQCDQLFDFLAKLNYTTEMKWFFELRIPTRNFSPKRDFIEDLS